MDDFFTNDFLCGVPAHAWLGGQKSLKVNFFLNTEKKTEKVSSYINK